MSIRLASPVQRVKLTIGVIPNVQPKDLKCPLPSPPQYSERDLPLVLPAVLYSTHWLSLGGLGYPISVPALTRILYSVFGVRPKVQ